MGTRGGLGGWGGQRPKKKFSCPKNQPQISGPFNNIHFLPEENVSDEGGWVGRPGLARAPNNAPPPPPRLAAVQVLIGAQMYEQKKTTYPEINECLSMWKLRHAEFMTAKDDTFNPKSYWVRRCARRRRACACARSRGRWVTVTALHRVNMAGTGGSLFETNAISEGRW